MPFPFGAAGISRKDGAGAGGIHLLWTAPSGAGYAAEGYDIQRRVAQAKEVPTRCYTLTAADLQKLQDEFRVDTPVGRVGLRRTSCPEFPPDPPDQPFTGHVSPVGSLTCINLLELPPGVGPVPLVVRGVSFLSADVNVPFGHHTEIVSQKGLRCAPRFVIGMLSRPRVVELTLLSLDDGPVTVERYYDDGSLAERQATAGPPGKPQTLRFAGGGIASLSVVSGGPRTYLQNICFEPPRCIDFQLLGVGLGPNPRIEQGVSFRRYTKDQRQIEPQSSIRTLANFTGLDCGFFLEIQWANESKGLELTLMCSSQPATVTVYSRNGTTAVQTTTGPAGKPQTLHFGGTGLLRVEVLCPADETLLLSFCLNPQSCVDFSAMPPGTGPNPRVELGATFRLVGRTPPAGATLQVGPTPQLAATPQVDARPQVGAPSQSGATPPSLPLNTNIVRRGNITGLDCGTQLTIQFPTVLSSVTLNLENFIAGAGGARVLAFHGDGRSAGQRVVADPLVEAPHQATIFFQGDIGSILIVAPQAGVFLLSCCFDTTDPPGGNLASLGRPSQYPTPQLSSLADASDGSGCWRYDLDLGGTHSLAQVRAGVPSMLAIALRDGKAVDTRTSGSSTGSQDVSFGDRPTDRIVLYVPRMVTLLRICVNILPDPAQEDAEWAGVPYIVQKIQLPLRTLNPALASAADENALAAARLLPGEVFDAAAFRTVADAMNAVGAFQALAAPVWYTNMVREKTDDPFLEIRTWPLALALLVHAMWRRSLGFGFLDPGANLTPNVAYDYRITARCRRSHVEEQVLGFHSVPLGTTLPASFHLGPLAFNANQLLRVSMSQTVPDTALSGVSRKGVKLTAAVLSIVFPAAVRKVVLEFSLDMPLALNYSAKSSSYFLGLSVVLHSGPVPKQARVELLFPEPIDTLTLQGDGFFLGVRIVDSPAGTSPEDIVPRSVIVPAVIYQDTAPPVSPPFLGTTNLQEPPIVGDPALAGQNPPQSLGFRLHWLTPALSGSSGPTPWPADLAAFPPFDAIAFHLERRRLDVVDTFKSLDGNSPPTLYFGNRGHRKQPEQLYFGADLLAAFAEDVSPEPPIPAFIEQDDVLGRLDATQPGPAPPPPGSLFQYRVFATDAIGRVSTPPTLGSAVRLELHRPPPQPVAPSLPTPPPFPPPPPPPEPDTRLPAGVRARILQKYDQNLPASDLTLLGANDNVIVLEWGYTTAELNRDPYARTFRVYFNPTPPDIVNGTLAGVAAQVGSYYEVHADLDQSLAADAMAGQYLQAGGYPFKVASHTAGASITIRFEPSLLHPDRVPAVGTFEFHPTLDGSEMRPGTWPERTAVVPITGPGDHRYIFQNRLTIDATHPTVRVWVGVSAADSQSYVADEVPSVRPNGGLSGNESSIAAVAVQAHHMHAPVFSLLPPLPNVPEVVTDEPVNDGAQARLDLPALLPTVTIPAGHRVVLERIGFDKLIAMISDDSGQIRVTFADESHLSYKLLNSADHAAFLTQIRTGTPGLVENRFLMNVLLRFPTELEPLWSPALPAPAPFGTLLDSLPGKAERYAHRMRLADPTGLVSAGNAILPQVVRVPSLRSPAAPSFEMPNSDTNVMSVSARVHDAFDLKWLVLFMVVQDALAPPAGNSLDKPQLLRVPNLRDRYPMDGIRLRLRDGTLLAPAGVVAVSSGTPDVPDRLLTASLAADYEQRVSVWAISMTRDGIPSRFAGPRTAFSGPLPIVIPRLHVTSLNGQDTLAWGPLGSSNDDLTIERSSDNGATWSRIAPWLPAAISTRTIATVSGALYRLLVRGSRGRLVTGPAVKAVP